LIRLPRTFFKLVVKFLAGSHLYGTNTPQSDIDERGVFIPTEEYFLGFLDRIEQMELKKEDIVYYDIRKFCSLAMEGNPNIIELLFVPSDKWIEYSSEWQHIVDNTSLFLSKKIKHTFSGYAHSQLGRIQRHRAWLLDPPTKPPERVDYGLPFDRPLISKDQIGAFNRFLVTALLEIREKHSLRELLEEMEETRDFYSLINATKKPDWEAIHHLVPVSENFIVAVQRERAYLQAKRDWDAYLSWKKNRNLERSELEKKFGYDTKHAAHLYRLMSECEELMIYKTLTFPRPDAEFLLDIRRGALSYAELMQHVERYDEWFNNLYDRTDLPHKPKIAAVNKLCINLCRSKLTEDFMEGNWLD